MSCIARILGFALFLTTASAHALLITDFDPNDFDFALENLTIAPGDIDVFVPPRHPFLGTLVPGTQYLAWLDNDLGSGTPDMVLAEFDGLLAFTSTSVTFANLLSFDDNSSPVGNGFAPAILGFVQPDGGVYLCASVVDDFNCNRSSDSGTGLTGGSGAYSFFLKLNPQVVSVPEASSLALFSIGLAGLGLFVWYSRRRERWPRIFSQPRP